MFNDRLLCFYLQYTEILTKQYLHKYLNVLTLLAIQYLGTLQYLQYFTTYNVNNDNDSDSFFY